MTRTYLFVDERKTNEKGVSDRILESPHGSLPTQFQNKACLLLLEGESCRCKRMKGGKAFQYFRFVL